MIPVASQPTAQSVSIMPPVGGLDTQSAISNMPLDRAVILDNWFCEPANITLRPSYTSHATGMSGAVETLIPYTAQDGTGELFAANAGDIYDVTTAGAIGAALVTGQTNDRYQTIQIGTAGGHFLLAMNGADTPVTYDGTTWSTATFTGPTVANLIWCQLHQKRLWFGEVGKLSGWYLAADAITGAATEFSIAAVAKKGGYIMAMGTWTRDGGSGPDDVAVFLTSEGEAVLYSGTDPADATKWGLVGVFEVGRPIGRRCMIKAGADLIMLTEDGILPASKVLSIDRSQAEAAAISAQINDLVNESIQSFGTVFGWQAIIYPKHQMLIVNSPQNTSTTLVHQYVFNTLTGAPSRFKGVNAVCWGIIGNTVYFGDSSGVVHQWDTTALNDNGAAIDADVLPAFNYFGNPGVSKKFSLVEPIFQSIGNPNAALDLNTDFRIKAVASPSQQSPVTSATWGVSKWGVGTWGTSDQIYEGWRSVRGYGRAASLRIRISTTTAKPSLVSINYIFVPGGQL